MPITKSAVLSPAGFVCYHKWSYSLRMIAERYLNNYTTVLLLVGIFVYGKKWKLK